MLQGLSSYCGTLNLPGLVSIQYAPVDWIDAANYDDRISSAWNWQEDIPFSSGDWLTMPVLPQGRIWEEREVRTEQGKYFEQLVSGVIPALRPAVSGELDEMSEHRFLLRLTDRLGQPWLLGTLETPFDFAASALSGENTGGLNSYQISFSTQTIHRAYGFVPL